MKNVITILIDSVYSNCIGTGATKESSTPFMDKLAAEGLFAPNVYSFGPYTDAATKGLYCAQPTLDDYGFYFCVNGSDGNHFKAFQERGYETYGFYYPYYLLSGKTEQYIDHSVYISGFLYESVWNGKLSYYADLHKEGGLNETDHVILEKCLDMVFDCWLRFYDNLESQKDAALIVGKLKSTEQSDNTGLAALQEEYKKYCLNKREYILMVLEEGMSHKLAGINDYEFGRHVNKEFLKNNVYDKYSDFFESAERVNKRLRRKNNPVSYSRFIRDGFRYIRTRQKEDLRYEINYGLLTSGIKLMKKRSFEDEWQLEASAGRQIDTLISVLDERDSDKPFYASLHVEEPHHNIAFFSYDIEDEERIKEEIDYLSPLIDGCGDDFKGNLMYQLSLRYVDYSVKRLFEYLEQSGKDKDTIILLVADHGSSYTFYPLRDTVTNNFHDENYHIPMIIWDKNMASDTKGVYDGLYTSADVFPTLLDIAGLPAEPMFKGTSVIGNPGGREVAISEYTGPGCPDLTRREIWIAGRTKKYTVAYRIGLEEDFSAACPVEIYDRDSDPLEFNNLSAKYEELSSKAEVRKIVSAVGKRFLEIRENTDSVICHINELRVV